LDHIL